MKLSALLTEFLYQHRSLNIPGIGHFFIDPAVIIPEADDKNFHEFLEQIRFENKSIHQPDEALIDFIRSRTGKIRPLAESDLDSFLGDCKLLINIGKPLYLEGIGTLIKNKSGKLEFTPGAPASEKIELYDDSGAEKTKERKHLYHTEYTAENTQGPLLRKIMIVGGILIGLVVIVWGGYLLYNKTTGDHTETTENTQTSNVAENANGPAPSNADTSAQQKPVDTTPVALTPPPVPVATDTTKVPFKFVLQRTTSRSVAESNFTKVKEARPDLRMETADSVTFKIYLVKKCIPADTAKVKEELNIWYWGKKEMKVYIDR